VASWSRVAANFSAWQSLVTRPAVHARNEVEGPPPWGAGPIAPVTEGAHQQRRVRNIGSALSKQFAGVRPARERASGADQFGEPHSARLRLIPYSASPGRVVEVLQVRCRRGCRPNGRRRPRAGGGSAPTPRCKSVVSAPQPVRQGIACDWDKARISSARGEGQQGGLRASRSARRCGWLP
jgi:hypothetical protein